MSKESATVDGEIYNTLNTTGLFLDTILNKLAPYECLGCEAEGQLLCGNCQGLLTPVPPRCYRCQRITEDSKTCPTCRAHTPLYDVKARAVYKGVAKDIIWSLKFNGAQAAAKEMAQLMKSWLLIDQTILLVPVPTATAWVRSRRYDQAQLLAKALSQETDLPCSLALRRLGSTIKLALAGRSVSRSYSRPTAVYGQKT